MTPTARLFASLLPATWPDRAPLLRTAERVDRARGGDGSGETLRAWATWRTTGELPANALLRDLLAALGLLLGGIASEMRFRPRLPSLQHPSVSVSAGTPGEEPTA